MRGIPTKLSKTLGLAALIAAAGGCFARTAVVSTRRNAYIVKGSVTGSAMYYCQVKGGKPVCTEVTEEE